MHPLGQEKLSGKDHAAKELFPVESPVLVRKDGCTGIVTGYANGPFIFSSRRTRPYIVVSFPSGFLYPFKIKQLELLGSETSKRLTPETRYRIFRHNRPRS